MSPSNNSCLSNAAVFHFHDLWAKESAYVTSREGKTIQPHTSPKANMDTQDDGLEKVTPFTYDYGYVLGGYLCHIFFWDVQPPKNVSHPKQTTAPYLEDHPT